MADGIEVLGGGAVAVDTDTLHTTAGAFLAAHDDLAELAHRVGVLELTLFSDRAHGWGAAVAASALHHRIAAALDGAVAIAARLREAAAVYELVELNAQRRAALLSGDQGALARIDAASDELRSRHPDAFAAALDAEFWRSVNWPGDLVRQATEIGMAAGGEADEKWSLYGGAAAGLATIGLAATAGLGGVGRLAPDSRLAGDGGPVTVTRVPPTPTLTAAPAGLASAARRMPGAGESRVRIERYTMPDGSRRFAVYVAGMQTHDLGGRDPWDNLSNAQLYWGNASASYAATAAALTAAGAEPGDVVHAFGHSQGAMIASHLALESGYRVETLVTFGSPVEAEVGSSTLSVGIRHADDPVAGLAGGGHVAPVGAAGSFVVEREADPAAGVHDSSVPAHRMVAYIETAALVDASTDPRVDALRGVFGELAGADAVEVMEFAASRDDAEVSPSIAGAG